LLKSSESMSVKSVSEFSMSLGGSVGGAFDEGFNEFAESGVSGVPGGGLGSFAARGSFLAA
jgi:hypothetical protein